MLSKIEVGSTPTFAGLTVDPPTFVVDLTNHRVGIGTATPAQKLHIEKGHIQLGQVAAPAAPTVAVNVAAGTLNGAYYYRISFVTALGETESGAASALVSPANQQVNLSAIPVSADSAVTSRKIYRTTADGSNTLMRFVATIADNTTTTYTDNIADVSLGVSEPRVNSTGGLIYNGSVRVGIADNASTAFGVNALKVNTGYSNTASGVNALYSNTTGGSNTASGVSALYSNTTGGYNTASGVNALQSNTTGYSNTASGAYALYSNTTGYSNTASGVNALYSNTTGGYNTASGVSALYSNTTGYSNTASGYQAGYNAGVALATLTNSIFIGDNANSSTDGLTDMIVIGSSAQGTASHQVTLGHTSITSTILRGNLTLSDPANMVLGATTGTQIGTAITQKLGLYGATPIVQRAGAAQAAVAATGATNTVPYGYTTAAQADAIVMLVNELRAALVALGAIKGAA